MIDESLKVRVIRAITGYDGKTMAGKLDVTPGTLCNWERGRSTPNSTNRKVLGEICEQFGIAIRPDGYPVLEAR